VQTYVQSGNVVFGAKKKGATGLTKRIEKMIADEFGFSVSVMVRSAEELNRIARQNPFMKERGIDPVGLHVVFLSDAPAAALFQTLGRYASSSERFRGAGREIYLHYPDDYGKSKLTNNVFEKALSVVATTRNWNTVNKLCEMMSGT